MADIKPTREQMRGIVLTCLSDIARANQPGPASRLYERFEREFRRTPSPHETYLLLELLSEQVLAGVVVFGRGLHSRDDGFPFVWVTEFGKRALQEGAFLPYDPDGFVARTKTEQPDLDSLCLRFLQEAVDAYARNLILSSSVMLGVASEHLMLRLVDAFSEWKEVEKSKFREAIRGKTVFETYKEVRKRFDPKLDLIPYDLKRDIHTYLDGMFNLIRTIRNEAGHPTDTEIPKNVLFANIRAFPEYAKRLIALRNFFLAQPQTRAIP